MQKKFLKDLIQIVSSILVLLSATSCTSPQYIFVDPEPIDIPMVSEFIDSETYGMIHAEPNIVEEPQTVNDLFTNIAEYKNAYHVNKEYAEALEDYIEAVITAVKEYGVNYELQDESY